MIPENKIKIIGYFSAPVIRKVTVIFWPSEHEITKMEMEIVQGHVRTLQLRSPGGGAGS